MDKIQHVHSLKFTEENFFQREKIILHFIRDWGSRSHFNLMLDDHPFLEQLALEKINNHTDWIIFIYFLYLGRGLFVPKWVIILL